MKNGLKCSKMALHLVTCILRQYNFTFQFLLSCIKDAIFIILVLGKSTFTMLGLIPICIKEKMHIFGEFCFMKKKKNIWKTFLVFCLLHFKENK